MAANYASQYETGAEYVEAWQRVSSTRLRKKIVKTWTRVYVGIPSEAAANDLLVEVLKFTNVSSGTITLGAGGMWTCNISFKLAVWVSPAVYMNG